MLFPKPSYDLPDLPTNLTELTDDVLMTLFSEFTGWQNYAAMQFAEAEVLEAKAQANVKLLEAQAMMLRPLNEKVTTSRAAVSTDEAIEQAKEEYMEIYAQRKLHGVIRENTERCANVLSRELTRRSSGVGMERRSMRWNP